MKTVQQLWRDYLFLSQEMTKFVNQNDFEMFESILAQREAVQEEISGAAEQKTFAKTEEFQKIKAEILAINTQVAEKIKVHKNNLEKQISLVHSYEFFGEKVHVGARFNSTT